jgi:hypothetical protein
MKKYKMEKKEADMHQEFGLVHSMIHTVCRNTTKIISGFEHNSLRIKQFQKSQCSDVDEALLNWF